MNAVVYFHLIFVINGTYFMFLEERRIFISSHCMRFHSRQFQGKLRPLPIAQENMSIRMTNRNVSCLVRRNN